MVSPAARERFDEARLITIANGLTAARVLLVPYFAFLLISGRGKAALAVFAVCGATDVLDGLLARWLRQRTLVGTLLDPIADKLMMATAFIVLSYVHILTVIYFLSIAAFPAEAKALGTGMRTLPDRVVTFICATTTILSGLQYLHIGIRKLSVA